MLEKLLGEVYWNELEQRLDSFIETNQITEVFHEVHGSVAFDKSVSFRSAAMQFFFYFMISRGQKMKHDYNPTKRRALGFQSFKPSEVKVFLKKDLKFLKETLVQHIFTTRSAFENRSDGLPPNVTDKCFAKHEQNKLELNLENLWTQL